MDRSAGPLRTLGHTHISFRDEEGEIHLARRRKFYVPVMIASALAMACAVALLAVLQKKAEATFPGTNGMIAYQGHDGNDYEIYTINSSGGDKIQITNNYKDDRTPR